MLELEEYVDRETETRCSEFSSDSRIAILKLGNLEVIEIDDITAMKWESRKLTLLIIGAVLMDFKDVDARQAFNSLRKLGIPIDMSLGKIPW